MDRLPAWMDEVCWQCWHLSVPELGTHCSFLASNPCDLKQRCWLESKSQSTVRKKKNATPCLPVDVMDKNSSVKEHALWSDQMHFTSSLCSSNLPPTFISHQDYDYSPVLKSCQPSLDGFPFDPQEKNKPLYSKTRRSHASTCSPSVLLSREQDFLSSVSKENKMHL